MSGRSCLLFTFLFLMITNTKCIAAQKQEQGFLSNHTWGHKLQLLKGVLWETWDALVPPMCLNCPSSCREWCQGHPAPVWPATPPSRAGPSRLWGTSREAACRQRGTHNTWIFAARWASIMHCIKIQNARAWSRQFKETAWAKQMPKKWKICPKLWQSARPLFK